MAEVEKKEEIKKDPNYKGNTTTQQITLSRSSRLSYTATADWVTLNKREKPIARMFHVAYLANGRGSSSRPITFVFNGGPGAASAYLHMGALGPRRALFQGDGSLTPPPAKVSANTESWIRFTDLVFIDPIGTGFSRMIEEEKPKEGDAKSGGAEGKKEADRTEFFEVTRDLESLGEFIQKFLSKHHRWTSSVFIAGESYGGFRVAKLARLLQEKYGVGLNGAVLISPAIEFDSLIGSDYNFTHWLELIPSMAAAAWIHGPGASRKSKSALETLLAKTEAFVQSDFLALLGQGKGMEASKRTRIVNAVARVIGVDSNVLDRCGGRLDHYVFARELLRDQQKVCGLYDASLTVVDPFPDRVFYEGPDPTLSSIDRIFQAAINSHLRETLGVETDLDYQLLSYEVFNSWTEKDDKRLFRQQVGAMDDLRYGMSLNPHMQVRISHGYFDLVTPYFSSNRLVEHMKLDDSLQGNLTTEHYLGGHMFYTWEVSRKAFSKSMEQFYKNAIP